jgi:hypothetical protein
MLVLLVLFYFRGYVSPAFPLVVCCLFTIVIGFVFAVCVARGMFLFRN